MDEKPTLGVKRLDAHAKILTKREEDAGYDFYGIFDEDPFFLYPGEIRLVRTGLALEFPKEYVLFACERGSTGIRGLATRGGVVDSGFRGEIWIPLNNTTSSLIVFTRMDEKMFHEHYPDIAASYALSFFSVETAIAQGVLVPCSHAEVQEVEELDQGSERKEKGFFK